MAFVTLFARVAAAVILIVTANALICYENDESGKIHEISNTSWNYCAYIPGFEESRVFGVGPEVERTEAFDEAFRTSDKIYQVLSICLLEKYDFGQLNPKSAINPSESVEFMFRCICSYDRCNTATTFNDYLTTIKLDNASSAADKN